MPSRPSRRRRSNSPKNEPEKVEKSWTRRGFVAAVAAALTGATCWGVRNVLDNGEDVDSRKQRAEATKKFFDSFPDKLPGAAQIKKYPVEGALCCFIDLEHRHRSSSSVLAALTKHMSPEKRAKFIEEQLARQAREEVQVERDIGLILQPLIDEHGITEFYLEGNTSTDEQVFHAIPESLANFRRSIQMMQLALRNAPPEQRDELSKQIKDLQSRESKTLNAVKKELGGAAPFFLNGKLKIRGPENDECLARAIEIAGKATPVDSPEWIEANKKREAAIFDDIQKGDVRYALFRCGKDHNFWDTIQNRNAEYPEYPFCLIEVTPSAVQELQSKK